MPATITISPDRTKLLITLVRDGRTVARDRIDPGSARARKGVCASAGVSDADLIAWTDEVRAANEPRTYTLPEPEQQEGAFYARPMDAARSATHVVPGPANRVLLETLPGLPVSSVLEWTDKAALCCLDVDYHDHAPPRREWLEAVVFSRLSPRPIAWHFSRGGGLHLFFVSCPPFTAEELAGVAALRFRAIDGVAGLELKTVVRGAGAERVHHTAEQDTGGAVLGDWLGGDGDYAEARDAWLESEGLQLDARYDHDKCPIDPTDEPGQRQPVVVSEAGVYCFRCAGKGMSLGCRKPGFAPWPAVLGAPSSGDLGVMVRGVAHWGHARWVLTERYGMPEPLARLAYSAALKARYVGTSREDVLPSVFDPRTDRIARSGTQWWDIAASEPYPKDILSLLGLLPAARYVDPEGRVKSDPAITCELNQTKDLSPLGYPTIERVHGFRIASVHQTPARTQVSVINAEVPQRVRPKYVLATKRMPEAEAWAELEKVFPRLDRKLIKAMLCSFGSAQETRSGMTPFLFVSGVSASGKSSHAKIAAAIYGAKVTDAVYDPDTTRFRQQLFDGAQRGPAVVVNEVLKDAGRRAKLSARDALAPLLNLTPDSSSWVAYRGPVAFGRVPAVFLTEPECPLSLRDEKQIARRVYHHRVEGAKGEWKKTLAAVRLEDMLLLRTVGDKIAAACDAILSGVCDDFFGVSMSWDEQAKALGIVPLDEDPNFDDPTPHLIAFYRLVCSAPSLAPKAEARIGKGFKRISRQDGSPDDPDELLAVYSMFADGTGADWLTSQRLAEKDWSAILRTDVPVRVDLKNDGVNVFVRFRSGTVRDAVVNDSIAVGV